MPFDLPEPWRVKVVEPIRRPEPEEREERLRAAGFNLFDVPAEAVFIDLLTDSGTSAMSDSQWAGLMLGDESYAGARNFYNFEQTVKEIFGFPYLVPVHQGRGAEHLLSQALITPGSTVGRPWIWSSRKGSIPRSSTPSRAISTSKRCVSSSRRHRGRGSRWP